mmetsp:Transcript_71571/g.207232  ORF Transcript_71571/g.207232 Transcript_71571/m.207232 type:complete len:349 (+) Transcript_71571:1088-2134(+)
MELDAVELSAAGVDRGSSDDLGFIDDLLPDPLLLLLRPELLPAPSHATAIPCLPGLVATLAPRLVANGLQVFGILVHVLLQLLPLLRDECLEARGLELLSDLGGVPHSHDLDAVLHEADGDVVHGDVTLRRGKQGLVPHGLHPLRDDAHRCVGLPRSWRPLDDGQPLGHRVADRVSLGCRDAGHGLDLPPSDGQAIAVDALHVLIGQRQRPRLPFRLDGLIGRRLVPLSLLDLLGEPVVVVPSVQRHRGLLDGRRLQLVLDACLFLRFHLPAEFVLVLRKAVAAQHGEINLADLRGDQHVADLRACHRDEFKQGYDLSLIGGPVGVDVDAEPHLAPRVLGQLAVESNV